MGADRRAERLASLRSLLNAESLDGLIVTHLPNVRYLTGFTGSAGVAVVLQREVLFVSDFRYRSQADAEIGDLARIEIVNTDAWARLWQMLRDQPGVTTLGFEAHATTVKDAERFSRPEVPLRLKPSTGLVERLRVRKDPGEVEAIRSAGKLALVALITTLG